MTLAVPLEYSARPVSGRNGTRRWEMFRGSTYVGDIVRWPENVWDWQPDDGDPVTVTSADDAIRAMLGTLPNEHEVPSSGD